IGVSQISGAHARAAPHSLRLCLSFSIRTPTPSGNLSAKSQNTFTFTCADSNSIYRTYACGSLTQGTSLFTFPLQVLIHYYSVHRRLPSPLVSLFPILFNSIFPFFSTLSVCILPSQKSFPAPLSSYATPTASPHGRST